MRGDAVLSADVWTIACGDCTVRSCSFQVTMASSVAQQKKIVEQLRAESLLQRKSVSASVKEMMSFMDENTANDVLLNGFTNKKENPFVEKGGCVIL